MVLALTTRFLGYFTGFSETIRKSWSDLTFAIFKADTHNRQGRVRLSSADPRDPPTINFQGFEDGTEAGREDLDGMVNGVERVRAIGGNAAALLEPEDTPGADRRDPQQLREFVRRQAWGHAASCTCPIGPREAGGVLTSDFRVYGTEGLRVVDASVFLRVPGFFIVAAVYMIAEKAADVILAAANDLDATGSRRAEPAQPLRHGGSQEPL